MTYFNKKDKNTHNTSKQILTIKIKCINNTNGIKL